MIPAHVECQLRPATTKAGRIQRVVLDLLLEHDADDALPTSQRFIFYELEQRGEATKPDPDDTRRNRRRSHGWPPGAQDLTDQVTWLRENSIIPWSWIVDESRTIAVWRHAPTVRDYLLDTLDTATLDPWDGTPPLILCESRATAGVLERDAGEYACPITGIGGQCAGFLRTEVAPHLEAGQPVLFLGDMDRAGAAIEANAIRVLEDETGPLNWSRLAMTPELAEQRNITPIWKVDGRDNVGGWAVEVEAIGQRQLVTLLREELDRRLPEPLARVHERARVEREAARRRLGVWAS